MAAFARRIFFHSSTKIAELIKIRQICGIPPLTLVTGQAGGLRLPGERGAGQEVPRAVRAVRAAAVKAAALRLRPPQHPLRAAHCWRLQARQPRQVRSSFTFRPLFTMKPWAVHVADTTLNPKP